ncbi:unnamed protein product, partial [Amoebophrya sp. A120]
TTPSNSNIRDEDVEREPEVVVQVAGVGGVVATNKIEGASGTAGTTTSNKAGTTTSSSSRAEDTLDQLANIRDNVAVKINTDDFYGDQKKLCNSTPRNKMTKNTTNKEEITEQQHDGTTPKREYILLTAVEETTQTKYEDPQTPEQKEENARRRIFVRAVGLEQFTGKRLAKGARGGEMFDVIAFVGDYIARYDCASHRLSDPTCRTPLEDALLRPGKQPRGTLRKIPNADALLACQGELPINASQTEAVNSFTKRISVIEGPPGTGKSTTIYHILRAYVMQQEGNCISSSKERDVYGMEHLLSGSSLCATGGRSRATSVTQQFTKAIQAVLNASPSRSCGHLQKPGTSTRSAFGSTDSMMANSSCVRNKPTTSSLPSLSAAREEVQVAQENKSVRPPRERFQKAEKAALVTCVTNQAVNAVMEKLGPLDQHGVKSLVLGNPSKIGAAAAAFTLEEKARNDVWCLFMKKASTLFNKMRNAVDSA